MKVKAILLYSLAVLLLIFGNRDLWDEVLEQRELAEKNKKLVAESAKNSEKQFEIQKLQYDSISGQWKNPHHYFQLINVSYVNFKAINKGKKTTIETDDDENASDSN